MGRPDRSPLRKKILATRLRLSWDLDVLRDFVWTFLAVESSQSVVTLRIEDCMQMAFVLYVQVEAAWRVSAGSERASSAEFQK